MAYRIGILGATGAVGQELIALFVDREFPGELVPLASSRSAGKKLEYKGKSWTVKEATPEAFRGLDFAVFSAGASVSRDMAPLAVKAGCLVIDNSSFFRMDPTVPLVVPEINGEAALNNNGIIANPNCSTAIALMGIYPLHKEFGLKRFFASTYQAASGAGALAMQELLDQLHAWNKGEPLHVEKFAHQLAFNVIPHIDKFLDTGYTKEEMKMTNEGRKIMSLPNLEVSCTCVRVPVMRAHSISIDAEFERPVDVEKARAAIAKFPGAELIDDPSKNEYPMPLFYSGKFNCGVGRIRKDSAFQNGLALFVSGDQLWRGAALNAILIAEYLHEHNALKLAK
jgi:aspartate-semialdehyde dehydrogenase